MNFIIESAVLQKLKPQIKELIELIQKSVDDRRPIFIRHHADTDGYAAGIALERAILPIIGKHQRRERDVMYYYQRLPSLTPYYSYEDATKDVQTFLRHAEQFATKAPLILLLDFGSGTESLASIQKVKIYNASVAVIDHHPPDEHITNSVAVHLNPHFAGSMYDYSAGMLCSEIGHLLHTFSMNAEQNKPEHDAKHNNFYFIAAVAGTADKIASEELKKYIALSSRHGFAKELIQKVAHCLDYEAHMLGPTSGKWIVHDLLGKDEKNQHKLLSLIDKQLEKLSESQLVSCLHYADVHEKKGFIFVKIPIEAVLTKNAYPPRGRSVGIVQEHFVKQGKKALVTGIGQTSINFRCNPEIKNFDVNGFIALCRKKFPYAQVSGGGHKVAGTVSFVRAAYDEILDELERYVDGLMINQ